MLYCAKPKPEPDSESDSESEPEPDPDPDPDPKPDSELKPSVNSQLYTPNWSSIIYPHNQAKEYIDVYYHNAKY